MSEDFSQNRRDQLLDSFRQSLVRPLSERYFDEDDIIDIFDYAGDVNDDYLRMEALLCGARFFPDSEELKLRRAIFYSQYSDEVRDLFLEDSEESKGLLWDILRLRQKKQGDDITQALNYMLESYTDYTDEEVIQLIDLASTKGYYSWLKDNFEALRQRMSYVNILLYETAIAADENSDNDFAIALLEELTQLEPFNHYYWQMLARQQFLADNIDQAISDIDYSLAIDATDCQSRLIKANLLLHNGAQLNDVIPEAESIFAANPTSIDALRFVTNVYNDAGEHIKAKEAVETFIENNPDSAVSLIPQLIVYRPDNADELLDTFYNSNEENTSYIWNSWAEQLATNGYPDMAKKVVDAYERNSDERLISLFHIEEKFAEGKFQETLDAIDSYTSEINNRIGNMPSLVLMQLLSLIKLNRFDEALAVCMMFNSLYSLHAYRSISQKLEYVGLYKLITEIKRKLRHSTDPSDWADFDPLSLWLDIK